LALALLNVVTPRLQSRGVAVSFTKRLTLPLAVASIFTILWSAPAEAQIGAPSPYPPPYPYAVGPTSAVRLEVTPRQAEVYVDGFYAGIVDDFDGMFQRLRVPSGEHEITLYRSGYRTARQRVYLTPDSTFKIKYQMQPLAPGDVAEPRPLPPNPPIPQAGQPQQGPPQPGPPQQPRAPQPGPPQPGQPQQPRAPQPAPQPPGPPQPGRPPQPPNAPLPPGAPGAGNPPAPDPSAFGTLSIRVQPADAEIVIDGQPWPATEGQDRLLVDASEGRHVVQIRKQGYIGYLTEADVRRGQTTTLNVSLRTLP
jgi:hypothetical protein